MHLLPSCLPRYFGIHKKIRVLDENSSKGMVGAWSGQVKWLTELEKLSKMSAIWGQ